MNLNNITIIVPTKNEENNIPIFLNSIPEEINLIIVDDSSDKTVGIVEETRAKRTQIFEEKGTVTFARQFGAKRADSDWLLFTDADVQFSENYFQRLQEYEDSALDALYGAKLSKKEFKNYYQWFTRGQKLSHKFGIPAASGSNMLVKRESFFFSGGFDLQLNCNEDSEFFWRIKSNQYKVIFDPNLIVYAFDHRRLYDGIFRKTIHSFLRCTFLYFDLIPDELRCHDWGYWSKD